ncbi:MAG: hypothetical protein AB8B64_22985 [Granulosicoccus sp.]
MNPVTIPRSGQAGNSITLPDLLLRTAVAFSVIVLSACQSTAVHTAPALVEAHVRNTSEATLPLSDIPASNTVLPASLAHAESVPWLSTIDADFALARYLVEKELDVDLSGIALKLVDDTPINAEVAHETQRLVNYQFGQSDFADHFLHQVMEPLTGTYAAVYSSRLSAVLISRSMLAGYEQSLLPEKPESTKRSALLTLLIHELVHAADDLRYNIHENRALNFRASFAQSATFEGHAQWATRRICEKAGCSDGLQALDNFMFSTNEESAQLTQPVEAISRSVLEYSYIEGERFVTGLAMRDNGAQLIDDLLSSPPLDPIQILAPETYPDLAREDRNQRLIQASRNVNHALAQPPWIGVDTSPLKGVDLRADPARRQAAVDGFTRLIQSMVSMQFYDQRAPSAMPIEATVLTAESAHTARLFATMLHGNTQQSGARIDNELLSVSHDSSSANDHVEMHIYRTAIDTDTSYRTSIVVAGEHVVQVSGNTTEQRFLDDFAIRVVLDLSDS